MGRSYSFAEIDAHARALAAYLQGRGLERGDRVAIMLPNVPQYPVAVAAILRAGYVVVNVNPLYTPRELEHQLKDSGARAIVVLENFAATLQQVLDARADQAGDPGVDGRHARQREGRARQPRGAQDEEAGAALPAAATRCASTMRWRWAAAAATPRRRSGRRTSPCCSTPAAPPASARARCCCTATWWPTCCRPRPGTSRR